MDSKKILHSGRVLSIENGYIKVGFETQGACGGCSARAKCGMSESSSREVLVPCNSENSQYGVGDQVKIAIGYQMGILSVVLAYVIPLIILIGILMGATSLGLTEGQSALTSLGAVAVYYVVIYLFRTKLDKQIKFTIEK